jgi:hypothetical protein
MARLVTIAALVGLALTASGAAGSQARLGEKCPKGALALIGTNPIAAATEAALRRVPAKERPQIRGALLAVADPLRGSQVRQQCGRPAAGRTIVVYVLRRAYLPAQSASQGVYFVSRFPTGYRVWQVAH